MVGISPEVFKRRKSSQVGDVGRIIHHTASKAHKPLADDDSSISEEMVRKHSQEVVTVTKTLMNIKSYRFTRSEPCPVRLLHPQTSKPQSLMASNRFQPRQSGRWQMTEFYWSTCSQMNLNSGLKWSGSCNKNIPRLCALTVGNV